VLISKQPKTEFFSSMRHITTSADLMTVVCICPSVVRPDENQLSMEFTEDVNIGTWCKFWHFALFYICAELYVKIRDSEFSFFFVGLQLRLQDWKI